MTQPKIAVSNEIKIEKDVPLPSGGIRRRRVYPFGDMEIGDSFEVSGTAEAQKLISAASYFGKRNGKRFTIQAVKQNRIPISARCWRVE